MVVRTQFRTHGSHRKFSPNLITIRGTINYFTATWPVNSGHCDQSLFANSNHKGKKLFTGLSDQDRL